MPWTLTPRYASKILYIGRGSEIELKYYRQIEESFFVLEGAEGEPHEIWLEPGDSQHVPAGRRHRIIALEDSEVLEVSAPAPDSDLHSSAH